MGPQNPILRVTKAFKKMNLRAPAGMIEESLLCSPGSERQKSRLFQKNSDKEYLAIGREQQSVEKWPLCHCTDHFQDCSLKGQSQFSAKIFFKVQPRYVSAQTILGKSHAHLQSCRYATCMPCSYKSPRLADLISWEP